MKKFSHAYSFTFRVETDREPHDDILSFEVLEAIIKKTIDIHGHNKWNEALGLPWDTRVNEEKQQRMLTVSQARHESSIAMGVKVIMSCIAGACSVLSYTERLDTTRVDQAAKN